MSAMRHQFLINCTRRVEISGNMEDQFPHILDGVQCLITLDMSDSQLQRGASGSLGRNSKAINVP